jgi:hypothetical protein
VPFDNVRKLIHLRRQDSSPLPGNNVGDFLRHGFATELAVRVGQAMTPFMPCSCR